MQGDERGGAGRVDGDGRPQQAQRVGDPAGGDAAGGAGEQVSGGVPVGLVERAAVPVVADTGEHAGAAAVQGRRVDAGPFDGLPGGLQQQALLRVHGGRLARRDAEEAGVELGRVVQESAVGAVRPAGSAGLRMVAAGDVPAAIGGEAGDRVHAVGDQLPELVGGVGAAREATADPDDRDGLAGPLLDLAQACLGLVQVDRGLLQVLGEPLFVRHSWPLLSMRSKISCAPAERMASVRSPLGAGR